SSSRFANTAGFTDADHVASPRDLAALTRIAMESPIFREIVATAQHGCTVNGSSGYRRNVVWRNTNRLLKTEGYDGVKTGTTRAAGACLVSRGARDGRRLIVVVLGSSSSDARYSDTRNLFRWAWRQLEAE
ncbi:MAG: D-alanyl-D-alanine carboxypeptidase, partial [Planctomycetota bacterium]